MKGRTGEMVLDRYRLEHPVGRGGFGRIFLATQVSLDRQVAIKVSSEENRDDSRLRERFRREAMLVASINHPHLVTYHEFGVDGDGDLILVMEFLKGRSLMDLARRRGPLSMENTARYMVQAAEGLQAAHEAGIVHRDVKPSNLFLVGQGTRKERLKVIDFGILRVDPTVRPGIADLTRTNHVIGTPAYLAPEMLSGGPVDGRADQYAMALVTLELVTGRRVYGNESNTDGILDRLEGTAPDLGRIAPEFPNGVRQVLQRALAKDPAQRYGDIAGFASALERAVQGDLTAPTRVDRPVMGVQGDLTAPTRVDRPVMGRRKWRVALLILVLAGVLAGWGLSRMPSPGAYVPEVPPLTPGGPREGAGPVSSPPRNEETPAFQNSEMKATEKTPSTTRSRRKATKAPADRAPAVLTLNARPWADVFLDGMPVGRTPLMGLNTAPGRHTLVFRHPRFGDRTFRQTVKAGQRVNFNVDLTSGRRADPRD